MMYSPHQGPVNWWKNHLGINFSILHGCMLRPSMVSKTNQFVNLKWSKGISVLTCQTPRGETYGEFCPVQAQFMALEVWGK